ncbi:putative RNA-directed DNA polymerase [Tanacetum coccineum]
MLIISTISEASFCHVQGTTSRDLWLSLEKAYAPHSTSREYTLKTQLLRIEMQGDETPDAYLNLSPIIPSGPQAFYGVRPSNNNRNNNNNNHGNRNNSCGNGRQFYWASTQNTVYGTCNRCGIGYIPSQCPNGDPSAIRTRPSANFANTRAQSSNAFANWHSDTGANSHVTPDLEAMDNSKAYYGDDALHVGNSKGLPILHIGSSKVYSPQKNESPYVIPTTDHPSPSSPRSPISSPSSVLHFSPTSQTSPESSNGQLSPVSTTSIPTPPPPIPPPPPPPITRQRLANLRAVDGEDRPSDSEDSTVHGGFALDLGSNLIAWTARKLTDSIFTSPISSPSSVSHLSPTSQTSPESSNGQPSPVSTTSIPTPPPPPPITRQRPANLRQNPKQRVPFNPSANHALRQQPGIDFHETFSPIVKSTTIRAVLSLAVTNGWPLRQLDIHNAFLHGNLKEHVYMKQPPGFIDPQRPNHVCNNKGTNDNIICQLGSAFALKDLGSLNYFLGIEIVSHVSSILLSQKKYILELLQSAGLSNYNLVSSPMVTSSSLSLDDNNAFSNPVKYRQVVGSLQYVTLSRPDITFAVNKVCQYMHAPIENHWSAVKRILRYLYSTVEHGMLIRRSSGSTLQAFTDVLWKGNPDTSLEAFSDADWTGDSDDRRSTGGFAIYLGSNLISWTARKQRTVSGSSTESEYKALADTVAELTWLQALLNELGICSSLTYILWCDNLGATYLSANPIFHVRTKHVEIDYHFIWEKVAQGDLRVQHISTHVRIADIFTKPLPTPRFIFLRFKLQVSIASLVISSDKELTGWYIGRKDEGVKMYKQFRLPIVPGAFCNGVINVKDAVERQHINVAEADIRHNWVQSTGNTQMPTIK